MEVSIIIASIRIKYAISIIMEVKEMENYRTLLNVIKRDMSK